MFNHLLLATDFSSPALLASGAAATLARGFGAKVTLLNVCAASEVSSRREGLEVLRDERFVNVAEVEIAAIASERADEAIVAHAEKVGADLVVAARHGEHPLRDRFVGSTTERVVRHAGCSTLVVHPATRRPLVLLEHVLVGTDFSEASLPAVKAAAYLARSLDAWVTLMHVYNLLPATMELVEEPYREGESHTLAATMTRKLEAMRSAELDQLPSEAILERDKSPVAAMCDFASDRKVDLVVVGTHGRTGMSRFLLGSVAERVVRHAPCSVMVVR